MTVMEITLLILGVVIFALSFILPELRIGKGDDTGKKSEAQIKQAIEQEMEHVKERIDEVMDETIEYTIEKTERSLAKVSNEKIMAVNEYSDTVLEEINKNHKEVMFLYDMLSDKQIDLKNTVRKVEATKDEAVAAIQEATVMEAVPAAVESVQSQKPFVQMMPEKVAQSTGGDTDIPRKEVVPQPIFSNFTDELERIQVSETEEDKTAPKQNGKNNNQRILELHKEGKTNVAIAKELGLGLGEVKLVIDLFEGV